MSKHITPIHIYNVSVQVGGIKADARAASLIEALRYAMTVHASNRKATPAHNEALRAMANKAVAICRESRDFVKRQVSNGSGGWITIGRDCIAQPNFAIKAGPRSSTNWDAVRNNFGVERWK